MRLNGTLTRWNSERGFGFIAPDRGDQDVFVHISALPKDGQQPRIGERLSFEIESGKDGRKRATAIARPGRASATRVRQRARLPGRWREKRSLFAPAAALILLAACGAYAYSEYSRRVEGQASVSGAAPGDDLRSMPSPAPAPSFQCDGRTHCTQMTSCDEAMFFLQNCPDTKMDGDRDGIPCERQHC